MIGHVERQGGNELKREEVYEKGKCCGYERKTFCKVERQNVWILKKSEGECAGVCKVELHEKEQVKTLLPFRGTGVRIDK